VDIEHVVDHVEAEMKIATCLTDNGEVGTPFEANSVCVFEKQDRTWMPVKEFGYFPVPDMGVNHARLLLKAIASQLTDCEVFLVSALRGYTHVWLEELGFRTWMSEGSLMEQLENVAEQDEKAMLLKQQASEPSCGTSRSPGCSSGCGGGCHGDSSVVRSVFMPTPIPIPVGDDSERHFEIDVAAILEKDSTLNSREVLIPILEGKNFRVLDVHFDHLPKWFSQTIDQLDLSADILESVLPAHGLNARITVKP
jgi:Fe-only nitrogenase accessory protein AnfO